MYIHIILLYVMWNGCIHTTPRKVNYALQKTQNPIWFITGKSVKYTLFIVIHNAICTEDALENKPNKSFLIVKFIHSFNKQINKFKFTRWTVSPSTSNNKQKKRRNFTQILIETLSQFSSIRCLYIIPAWQPFMF